MISDREIWQCALLIVKRYGADAGNQAALRANDLASKGDDDGCVAWVRIARAIERLQATKPNDGEQVN